MNSSGGRIDGESQVQEVDGLAQRGESPLERSEVQGGLKQFPIVIRTDPDANDVVDESLEVRYPNGGKLVVFSGFLSGNSPLRRELRLYVPLIK